MQIRTYDLPTVRDGRTGLERKIGELLSRTRNGGILDPEECDWLDWAEVQLSFNNDEGLQ